MIIKDYQLYYGVKEIIIKYNINYYIKLLWNIILDIH